MEKPLRVNILGRDSIIVGYDVEAQIASETIEATKSSTYVLVSDSNLKNVGHVDRLAKIFRDQLNEGQRLLEIIISPGEMSKSRETKAWVEDYMLSQGCTRDTVILAFGGGVIGDMIGFVAATFMRGIRFVQIPTTLLAMVDSSIGGKTAIDTPTGKNLIGAFWQPVFNFLDVRYLETLPEREFINGMAEVIKTAAIWDESEFTRLERLQPDFFDVFSRRTRGTVDITPIKDEILAVVAGSARIKADIVNQDEREGGLRNIVNFGHTIGHAYEALLTPHILHGECVSIGMVLEAELSRHLGRLSAASVARLAACLKSYQLPVTVNDPLVMKRSHNKFCKMDDLLKAMAVDKKNEGSKKKAVLLKSIGECSEPRATVVADSDIRFVIGDKVGIQAPVGGEIRDKEFEVLPPGSKSISNRVLVLSALGEGTCRIHNLLHSDDTGYMLDSLQKLNAAHISKENGGDVIVVSGNGGKLHAPEDDLYLGNAGTAARFLSALSCLVEGEVCLNGNKRMQERPIGPLVDALRVNGTAIDYRNKQGSLPLIVHGKGLQGGRIELAADISSQYVSAVLMCAPYAREPVTLALMGRPVSQFYIDMTIQMMADFGVVVEKLPNWEYRIPQKNYKNPEKYVVESDASSATYPLALAALTGTKCTVPSIGTRSLQGDARFAMDVLKPMGCTVTQTENSTTVQGPVKLKGRGLVDMEPMTDAFLTACVVAAFAEGTTEIVGIANQHVKECDRINAMATELGKFGVKCVEKDDGIIVEGGIHGPRPKNLHSYDDHRVAMSMSLAALASLPTAENPVVIDERRCVEKTWPGWWDTLAMLGIPLQGFQAPPVVQGQTKHNSIIIIGMRGAGKTSSGSELARLLGWKFADLDVLIEQGGRTVGEIIHSEGWDFFREYEAKVLQSWIREHPYEHILASGGGIVETEIGRATLKSHNGDIVHIHRPLSDIVSYLTKDKTRPAYGEDIVAVWQRREKYYEEIATRHFFQATEINADALRRTIFPEYTHEDRRSYFVSLTADPSVINIAEFTQGAQAVELRVDLLSSHTAEHIAKEIALLRSLCTLPVVYTVRTAEQGGKFVGNCSEYAKLIELGYKLGADYVDIELSQPAELQKKLKAAKGVSRIIASHHDPRGQLTWDSMVWKTLFFEGTRLGDIIKFVGYAHSFEQNLELERFRASVLHTGIPFIGINMGPLGQLSRVLNPVLTPVSHEGLGTKAAPGQLSIREINVRLTDIGGLSPKQFFVCGSPINHSQSPNLHNASYAALGLPHRYNRFETKSWDDVLSHIKKLGPDFGGCSVTIPLKEQVVVDEVTKEATLIGAVNTVSRNSCGKLVGDNTDWIGIVETFAKFGLARATGSESAVILGAGGTSLAAVYALHHLGFSTIYILNRGQENAHRVASHFPAEYNVQVLEPGAKEPPEVRAIVSCIPGDITIPSGILSTLRNILDANIVGKRYLLEAAYKPDVTNVMSEAKSHNWIVIPGREMLVRQGVAQFKLWTGMEALIAAEKAVL